MAIQKGTKELIKKCLMRGLVWSGPAILTIWLMSLVFGVADKVVGPITRTLINLLIPTWLQIGPLSPGGSQFLSFVLLLLILTVLGGFVSWRYGERLVRAIDGLISTIPGVGFVYRNMRKMAAFFDGEKGSPFERVVMIPYPHAGIYTVAFVAGRTVVTVDGGKEQVLLKVVVPNPPTGVQGICMVPEELARDVNMSVEEGIQFYVSLGVVAPERFDLTSAKKSSE